MSITSVQSNSVASASSVSSQAITLGAGLTLGNLVVVSFGFGNSGITLTTPGSDANWKEVPQTPSSSGNLSALMYYLVVTATEAGQTSWTWNLSSSHSITISIREWNSSTGWLASPLDQSQSASASSGSATMSAGTTGTLGQATELAVADLCWVAVGGVTDGSLTSGWTSGILNNGVGNGDNTREAYQITSATTALSCQETLSTSEVNCGIIGTFKPAAATAGVQFDAVGPSGGGGATGTASGLTWTHNPAAGAAVLVGVALDQANNATTCTATFGGVSMTALGSVNVNGLNQGYLYVFGIANVASGSQSVVVTFSGTTDVVSAGSISYTGAGTTVATAFGGFQHTTAGSGTQTLACTSTSSLSQVCGFDAEGGSSGNTGMTSPAVSRFERGVASSNSCGSIGGGDSAGTGGTVTLTWTPETADFAIGAVEVLPAGGSSQFPAGGPTISPSPVWLHRFGDRRAPGSKFQLPVAPPAVFADTDAEGPAVDGGEQIQVISQSVAVINPSPLWLHRFGDRLEPGFKLATPVAPPAQFSDTDVSTSLDGGEQVTVLSQSQATPSLPPSWKVAFSHTSRPQIPIAPPAAFSDSDVAHGTDAGELLRLSDSDVSGPELDGGETVQGLVTVQLQFSQAWKVAFSHTGRPQIPVAPPSRFFDSDFSTSADVDNETVTVLGSDTEGAANDNTETIGVSSADASSSLDGGETVQGLVTVPIQLPPSWKVAFSHTSRPVTAQFAPPPPPAGVLITDTDSSGPETDAGEQVAVSYVDFQTVQLPPSWKVAFSHTGRPQTPIAPPSVFADTDSCHGSDGGETAGITDTDGSTSADGGESILVISQSQDTVQLSQSWKVAFSHTSRPQIEIAPPSVFADTDSCHGTDGGETAGLSDSDSSSGSDGGTIGVSDSDAMHGTDNTETVALADTDSCHGTDAGEAVQGLVTVQLQFPPSWKVAFVRTSRQQIEIAPPSVFADSDSCRGTDNTETISLSDTDSCHGTDAGETVQGLVTVQLQFSPAWKVAFSHTGRPVLPQPAPPLPGIFVTDSDAVLGYDAEITQHADSDASNAAADLEGFTKLSDADSCHGTDGGEALTGTFLFSDSDKCHGTDGGEALTGTFLFSDSDKCHGMEGPQDTDQVAGTESSHILGTGYSDSDASGPETDAGERVRVLIVDSDASGAGADTAIQVSATLRASDSSAEADAGEQVTYVVQEVADSDRSGAAFDSSAAVPQADAVHGTDLESAQMGPNAAPSDGDTCSSSETHVVGVYAYQPLFRFTGGGFELHPRVTAEPGLAAFFPQHLDVTVAVAEAVDVFAVIVDG